MDLDIRVLGRIRVTLNGTEVRLRDRKSRIMFAVLAMEGSLVEQDRLARFMWGDEPHPQDRPGNLHTYAKHIRAALDEASPGSSAILETVRGIGYALRIAPGQVDYHRFRQRKAEATAVRRQDSAARLGRQALAEWTNPAGLRGSVLEIDEPQLQGKSEALRQEYRSVLMLCLRAELACGRHEALLPELTQLANDEYGADDEELARMRMLAHFRAGQLHEALAVFDRLAVVLEEKYGSGPTPETKKLKYQIVNNDEELRLGKVGAASSAGDADAASAVGEPGESSAMAESAADADDADEEATRKHRVSTHIYNEITGDRARVFQAERDIIYHERPEDA